MWQVRDTFVPWSLWPQSLSLCWTVDWTSPYWMSVLLLMSKWYLQWKTSSYRFQQPHHWAETASAAERSNGMPCGGGRKGARKAQKPWQFAPCDCGVWKVATYKGSRSWEGNILLSLEGCQRVQASQMFSIFFTELKMRCIWRILTSYKSKYILRSEFETGTLILQMPQFCD